MENKISTFYNLGDEIDNICTYLDMKDLCHVSQISKTWNEAATREKVKRCHIRRLLIPYDMDEKKISSLMYRKPYVTLLFFDIRLSFGNKFRMPDEIWCRYRKLFPNNLIALTVYKYFMNEDASFNSLNDFILKTKVDEDNILGLLFPMENGLDIKVCWSNYDGNFKNLGKISDQIIKKLEMDEAQKQNSAFLLFAQEFSGLRIAKEVNDAIRRRFENNKHTVWIAPAYGLELEAGCESKKYDELPYRKDFVALRISSSSFESWTLTMDLNVRGEEFNVKLYEFKNKIQLKPFTFGFVYLPSQILVDNEIVYNYHEIMETIRQIFSGVRIVGLIGSVLCGFNAIYSIPAKITHAHDYLTMVSMIVIAYC